MININIRLPKSLKTIAYKTLNSISKLLQGAYALLIVFKTLMPIDKLKPKYITRQ